MQLFLNIRDVFQKNLTDPKPLNSSLYSLYSVKNIKCEVHSVSQ